MDQCVTVCIGIQGDAEGRNTPLLLMNVPSLMRIRPAKGHFVRVCLSLYSN